MFSFKLNQKPNKGLIADLDRRFKCITQNFKSEVKILR